MVGVVGSGVARPAFPTAMMETSVRKRKINYFPSWQEVRVLWGRRLPSELLETIPGRFGCGDTMAGTGVEP